MAKENSFEIEVGETVYPEVKVILQYAGDPEQTTTISFWDCGNLLFSIDPGQFKKLVKGVKKNWKGNGCPV